MIIPSVIPAQAGIQKMGQYFVYIARKSFD